MEDSGVGVTKKGLVNNLGTVVTSGSKACMEAMNASGNISRIGQVGASFYSASLLSEQARVAGNDDVGVGWWFVRRAEGHRDGLRGGHARNKDQFLIEGRSVQVLGGTSIDGFGEVAFRFHWFLK